MMSPNNAPGLYIHPTKNAFIVVMNTYKQINEEVVINDIPDGQIVVGNPAKPIKRSYRKLITNKSLRKRAFRKIKRKILRR